MAARAKTFLALGERIDRAWRARGYEEHVFPEIATQALEDSNPSSWARPGELLRSFLGASDWPAQHKIPFGKPSVVVYQGQHFFIEMLCWTTATVGIHRHGFSGAFHVMMGSSLHSTFDFEVVRRINSRFLIGDLIRTGTELLETGTTRAIPAVKLIHSAFHLETPSITIVVRTRVESEAKPQYTYEPPYLAVDSFYDDAFAHRHVETLGFLLEARPKGYQKTFAEFVTGRDLRDCYEGLRIAFADDDLFAELLRLARKAHGPDVDLLVPVVREAHRRIHLVAKRAQIKNVEHRFFLGMLLNLERREDILRLVRARYRGAAGATILRWIRELSLLGTGDPAFDLELADAEADVLRALLDGRSLIETYRVLARRYGASEVRAQRDAIASLYEALRANEVYRPLFTNDALPRLRSSSRR